MIEILTSIFSGAMLPLLPLLLLQTIRGTEEKSMVFAWSLLAFLAWGSAVWMSFLVPWAALIGLVLGGLLAWLMRTKPDFQV